MLARPRAGRRRAAYTHALTMDSDGQHPADRIERVHAQPRRRTRLPWCSAARCSMRAPRSLRVKGRKISNWWANLETLWAGIGDSLFGFRVYPIAPLMRRDAPPAVDAPLRFRCRGRGAPLLARRRGRSTCQRRCATSGRDEGGVSHFNYWRDNALLTLDALCACSSVFWSACRCSPRGACGSVLSR